MVITSVGSAVRSLPGRRLGLIPLLVLPAGAIAVQVFGVGVVSPSPLLVSVLNTVFLSLVGFGVAWFAAKAFYRSGSLQALWLGSATLVLGFGNLLGAWLNPLEAGNVRISACAGGALIAAIFCTAGAVTTLARVSPLTRARAPSAYVVSIYGAAVLSMVLVLAFSARGIIPPFFVAGAGDTPFRQAILTGSPITNRPALTASFAGIAQPSRPTEIRAGPSFWISPVTVMLAVMP